MPEQWPRALVRAALREEGYDAVGARSLREAVTIPKAAPERGPVCLVIVDAGAVEADAEAATLIGVLSRAHEDGRWLLVAPAARATPPGPWDHVVRRPVAVEDVVAEVRRLLPLPAEARRPLDD